MVFDDPSAGEVRLPREQERPYYTEKKYGDELFALWETDDLPADAKITHVTLIPMRGERAVVAWRDGSHHLPEGDLQPGESVDAAIRRVALEQTGISESSATRLGQVRYRANTLSKTQAPGTITYQVLYALDVTSLADFPADPASQRRIVLQRDLMDLLRTRYSDFRREYMNAFGAWLLERIKSMQAGSA